MCGRYSLYNSKDIFLDMGIDVEPNYNISPGSKVLVIDINLKPIFLTWGVKVDWINNLIINARLETLKNKRFYSDFKRCVFVANGFIEWKRHKGNKNPYYIYSKNKFLYFAGLYKFNEGCIVTTSSHSELLKIHHRQPLILSNINFKDWLFKKNESYNNNIKLFYYSISKNINNARNNYSALLDKID